MQTQGMMLPTVALSISTNAINTTLHRHAHRPSRSKQSLKVNLSCIKLTKPTVTLNTLRIIQTCYSKTPTCVLNTKGSVPFSVCTALEERASSQGRSIFQLALRVKMRKEPGRETTETTRQCSWVARSPEDSLLLGTNTHSLISIPAQAARAEMYGAHATPCGGVELQSSRGSGSESAHCRFSGHLGHLSKNGCWWVIQGADQQRFIPLTSYYRLIFHSLQVLTRTAKK